LIKYKENNNGGMPMKYLKVLAVLFSMFIFQGIAFADFVIVKDPNTSCQIKLLRPLEQDESISWSGACEGGFASGEGIFIIYDKKGVEKYKYSGAMNDGIREGFATIVMKGLTYEGDVKNCLPEGKGKLTYSSSTSNIVSYEGEFRNGFFNGKGTMIYKDKSVYTGEFKNGLRDGYGTFKDSNGKVIYDGIWKENVFLGKNSSENQKLNEVENVVITKDLDSFWGIKFGITKKELEDILRQKNLNYSFKKMADNSFFYIEKATFYKNPSSMLLYLNERGQFFKGGAILFVKEEDAMGLVNSLVCDLNQKYGHFYSDKGEYLEREVQWLFRSPEGVQSAISLALKVDPNFPGWVDVLLLYNHGVEVDKVQKNQE
jgi:hypothetical protein